MSNQNNLIRPPVLGNIPAPSHPQPNPVPQATPELANLIRNLVTQFITTDGQNIIRGIVSSVPQVSVDETIDELYRDNISDLDKTPDIVKSLREFSGKQEEFSSWRKSVERILKIYENKRGTPKYFGIINVIRNKIVGQADSALEAYNTPLDWKAVVKCLTVHYADKRDIGTLEYQMTCLVQGRNTVREFYTEVHSHLSLILNNVSSMDISEESMKLLTANYREKALDTFVRGLNGDLPRLLGMTCPADLPEALYLYQKLENQNFRAQHANHQQYQSFNANMRQPVDPRPPQRLQNYPSNKATTSRTASKFLPRASVLTSDSATDFYTS